MNREQEKQLTMLRIVHAEVREQILESSDNPDDAEFVLKRLAK